MIVIIKKGENVNHASFRFLMMLKRNCLIIILIIKKEENVNNAGFDDAKKNSLANDCHHKKGGDYECMNT